MTAGAQQPILITGANGFIGRSLCGFLEKKGCFVRGAVRCVSDGLSGVSEYITVGDIHESTDWRCALAGVDTVIHGAARVHIQRDRAEDSLEAFRKVNVLGTERLARMAVQAGVRRFIFISSVKVNGEGALRPYCERDVPDPQDAYGMSKREAEDSLIRIAQETGLETVIVRLPLVYGPGVKANFKSLIKIAGSGLPLPLKGINNLRSFLYVGNLTDVLMACIRHPLAKGETFLVSDGQDVSTADLIKMIACALDKKPILFYVHPGILKAVSALAGKTEELEKLTGSLFVDSSKIRNVLGWKPPFTMEEGIRETVKGL